MMRPKSAFKSMPSKRAKVKLSVVLSVFFKLAYGCQILQTWKGTPSARFLVRRRQNIFEPTANQTSACLGALDGQRLPYNVHHTKSRTLSSERDCCRIRSSKGLRASRNWGDFGSTVGSLCDRRNGSKRRTGGYGSAIQGISLTYSPTMYRPECQRTGRSLRLAEVYPR